MRSGAIGPTLDDLRIALAEISRHRVTVCAHPDDADRIRDQVEALPGVELVESQFVDPGTVLVVPDAEGPVELDPPRFDP